MKKVVSIVGARPQFIKSIPVSSALTDRFTEVVVHTGQHYDAEMSDVFFKELGIEHPQYELGIGSGSHGEQTGAMLMHVEEVLFKEHPDCVIVYGDTNSTLAGALAAAKLNVPIAHVEAGLRSYDRTMPEEVNRVVADHLASVLFCPTHQSIENLRIEGIGHGIEFVGDVMYDVMRHFAPLALERSSVYQRLEVAHRGYVLCTIHRAANTDERQNLERILHALASCGEEVVFPIHPRTSARIAEWGLDVFLFPTTRVKVVPPVGYLDFVALEQGAKKIVTDSGGVQKEAYWHGIPCITVRDTTEWVETVDAGWNVLVGTETGAIVEAIQTFDPAGERPEYYGDGTAGEKIADALDEYLSSAALE